MSDDKPKESIDEVETTEYIISELAYGEGASVVEQRDVILAQLVKDVESSQLDIDSALKMIASLGVKLQVTNKALESVVKIMNNLMPDGFDGLNKAMILRQSEYETIERHLQETLKRK